MLGIILVLCVVLIATGIGIWKYGVRQQEMSSATIAGNTLIVDKEQYSFGVTLESAGIGTLAVGSGLFIIGTIFIILEHKQRSKL